jgi:hypothetical protein
MIKESIAISVILLTAITICGGQIAVNDSGTEEGPMVMGEPHPFPLPVPSNQTVIAIAIYNSTWIMGFTQPDPFPNSSLIMITPQPDPIPDSILESNQSSNRSITFIAIPNSSWIKVEPHPTPIPDSGQIMVMVSPPSNQIISIAISNSDLIKAIPIFLP